MRYPFIDKTIWEAFVKYHNSPDFLVKSLKGKENKARNIYAYILSCGGYDKLE